MSTVLLRQTLVVVTSDMNTRLRSVTLAQDCEVEAFLSAAEPHLSDELKASVGDLLFDGSPRATYEEWLDDVRLVLRIIEEGTARSISTASSRRACGPSRTPTRGITTPSLLTWRGFHPGAGRDGCGG